MYKPIIFRLACDFGIQFNVLEAKIYPKQEGRIILELRGSEKEVETSINYLQKEEVIVEYLKDKIKREDTKCIHCGACTSVCRVEALAIVRPSMEVQFTPELCVACGLCKKACPVDAMSGISIDI